MVATISFNPFLTTNATGSFNITDDGFIQGTALDAPAVRYQLSGGILANSETLPMWGGVGISTAVPGVSGQPAASLGPQITRATNISTVGAASSLTGFSVFDQDHAMLTTPQSPVPLVGSYGAVHFYRLGSRARIAVAIDPALVSLEGGIETAQVSWDFTLQRLIPGVAAYPADVFTVLTRALVSGIYVATATTTSSHGVAVGDDFTVSGCVPTAYNGTWTAITGTTGSTLKWNMTAVDPGAETTLGQLNA